MLQLLPLSFLPGIFKINDSLSAKRFEEDRAVLLEGLVLFCFKEEKLHWSEFVLTHI